MRQLLLLSSSTTFGTAFLEHAATSIAELLGGRRLVFVPYALRDHAGYTARVRAALPRVPVVGITEAADPIAAARDAEAVFVGGGNTFRLLRALQDLGLVAVIRERVLSDSVPYLGSSAGTNVACPSLRTTNDMPIVQPPSFEALGLVPFQINPHYADVDPCSTHMGETREERITQFMEENDVPVLGLREGSWLRVIGETAATGGTRSARLFTRGSPPREMAPGEDVSALLTITPCFDQAEPSGRQA